MMPKQLATAKRPKRTTPRPLVETLQRIDIIDLCRWNVFPSQYDWHKATGGLFYAAEAASKAVWGALNHYRALPWPHL
jgi:hypothetical protein